ncbi:MAG: sensor histidine kinase, partial [Polyangiaceae bacterium]
RLTLNRTEGELVGLIEEVVERLAELAADAGCQVTLDKRTSHAMGYYDPLRVEQVITNVLENAMKYGAGKPVRLVVDSEGGHATVEIVDQGPGIPPGDLERIFGRFERAASRLNYGGFGLGLFLAREIVSAHGGTITAQNEPAAGARIRIRLPLGAQPAPAQRPPLV